MLSDLDEFPDIRDNDKMRRRAEEIAKAMFYTWSGGRRVLDIEQGEIDGDLPAGYFDKAIIRLLEIYIWG